MVKILIPILLLFSVCCVAQTKTFKALRNIAENTNVLYPMPKTNKNGDTITTKSMVVDSLWNQTDSTIRVQTGDGTYDVKALSPKFIASGQQTYSGQETWNGTPPTTGTLSYRYTRFADVIIVRYNLSYTGAGSGNSSLVLDLPTGLPLPAEPSGFTANSSILLYNSGNISTGNTTNNPTNAAKAFLRKNSGGTGYEVVISLNSGIAATSAWATIMYFTNQ